MFLSGCSSSVAPPQPHRLMDEFGLFEKEPPQESFNKAMLELNFFLDEFVLEPASKVYHALVPEVLQVCVGNFTNHLKIPFYVVNDLFQGDLKKASTNIWVFGINTFFGMGLFNASQSVGMLAQPNDMGKTFYKWGVGSGPFLVLPLIGPTYLRDAVGSGMGIFTDPINTALMYQGYTKVSYGITAIGIVHKRSEMGGAMQFIRSAYDPYAMLKSIYEQKRATELGEQNK